MTQIPASILDPERFFPALRTVLATSETGDAAQLAAASVTEPLGGAR